jgi:chromosome segregation ATPase
MQQSHKTLAFLFVAMLGLYGCAKGPVTSSNNDAALREKLQRIEKDYQTTVTARDDFRTKLTAAEEQQAHLRSELEQVRATAAREKADLSEQLKSRTAERDTMQTQYDGFRKNIKELIGQAEASLPNATPSTLAKSTVETSNRN